MGTAYSGNDIGSVSNIKTWEECSDECDKDVKCQFWAYSITSNKCYLKSSDRGRRVKPDGVAGRRGCKGVTPATTSKPLTTTGE